MAYVQGVDAVGPQRSDRRLRRLAIDITPLRISSEYRRLWAGQTIDQTGTQLTNVAVPVQVYDLTHSSLAVGLLGIAALVPLIVSGLVGATLVDAMDRRRLALLTAAGFVTAAALLFTQQVAHWHQLWLLYLVVAVQNGLMGIDSPTRRAFIPRLLPARQVPAANALSQLSSNVAMTGGPLLAGLLLATSGLGSAYLLDVVSFSGSGYALLRLRPMPPQGGGTRAGLASTLEGFRFLRGQPVVLTTFVADVVAMVFGMPRALFPALAQHRFHGGGGTVGLLYSAIAAGALVGAISGGWLGRVRRQGLAVLGAIVVWGVAIVGFGLVSSLAAALGLLALAGAADFVSAVFRSTILQLAAPDAMQGRIQGVFTVVVAGGPRLGDLEAGVAAVAGGLEFAVVSGGLACLVGMAIVAARVPTFRRYRVETGPG
ncbi:MAG TPA: MFS transporter [Mycobacteriales bacterium]|nr:MFS transporter [Mycobacteriales bacterium]